MNTKKDEIQNKACDAWYESGGQNTVIMHTGMGKTFTFFKSLLKTKCKQVLFLAETTVREQDVLKDVKEFEKFFKVNPLKGINFKFMCYHSAYKTNIQEIFPEGQVFVCADEVHELCTLNRWQFVDNSNWNNNYFLGLTATLDKDNSPELEMSKYEFLNATFPVCFEYHISDAKVDGTTRQLEVWTYLHKLDNKSKTVTAGNKDKKWMQTESDAYDWLDSSFKKCLWLPDNNPSKEFLIRNAAAKRANFLYNLPSKTEICKKLLAKLPGRTLVFGQTTESLEALGIPTVVASNKKANQILEDFRNFKISQIGSNKILQQGANLGKIDNIIFLSYYSKEGHTKQRAGRARQDLPEGKIIVFKTIGTQEEKWYDKMIEPLLTFPQKKTDKIEDIWII